MKDIIEKELNKIEDICKDDNGILISFNINMLYGKNNFKIEYTIKKKDGDIYAFGKTFNI